MLCSRLYELRYSLRPYLNGARWSPRPCSRDRDVAFFRADFARLCYRLPLPPRWSLCQWNSPTLEETITYRLVCCRRKYPLFYHLFPRRLILWFWCPSWSWLLLAAQTAIAASLSLKIESLAVTRCVFAPFWLALSVYLSVRLLLCEYAMLFSCRVQRIYVRITSGLITS